MSGVDMLMSLTHFMISSPHVPDDHDDDSNDDSPDGVVQTVAAGARRRHVERPVSRRAAEHSSLDDAAGVPVYQLLRILIISLEFVVLAGDHHYHHHLHYHHYHHHQVAAYV